MEEQLQEMLDSMGYEDWYVIDDVSIESPNGHIIEWDGISPDGEKSPLMALGIV